MISHKYSLLLLLLLLCFVGCAPGQAQLDKETEVSAGKPSLQDPSNATKPDPETAKIIRQLAGAAAGMTEEEFKNYVGNGSTPNPARLTNQPLTTFIANIRVMDLPEGAYEDRLAEFRFSGFTPNPNKVIDALKPTETVDYWTALHPEYITNVTCDADRKTATGVISFDASIFSGNVQYSASKVNKSWQINEFSFPIRDWRFVRSKDGSWQWFDHFGHIQEDRELPTQDVVGQILVDDEPLAVGRVYFYLNAYPEFFFDAKVPRGRAVESFMVSVPAGKYIVSFDGKEIPDKKYSRRSTSDLIAEIEEGQTELTLKIKSTPK